MRDKHNTEEQLTQELAKLHQRVTELEVADTERKRAEEALRASAQQWRTTFDAINDAVCLLDMEGRILRCNKAMTNLVAKPFSEIIGHTCWELMHGTSEPIEGCPIVRMWETRRRETLVLPIGDRWFNVSADPVLDEAGALTASVHIITDTTERKRAEEELRTQRDKFEGIIASLTDGLDIVSRDYRVHFQNKMLRDRFGDLTGKLCYEEYMAREIPCEPCPMVKAIATGSTQRVELTGADGREYEVTSTPFQDIDGETKVIEVVRDITERKRAKEALQAYATEKKAILDAMSDIVLFQDTNLSIRWGNEAAGRSVGKTQQELVGCYCYELWHGRSEPCEGCPVLRALETGSHADSIMMTPDGRWWEITGEPVRDRDGKTVGAIEIAHDITERKQAEEELRESEELYTNIVESMSDGIMALDRDFHYTHWNHAMERISKVPREELVGTAKCPWDVFPHLVEQGVDEMMRRAMHGEVVEREAIPYRLPNGTRGFTSEIFLPLQTATGEIRGIVGVIRDITERMRAEEELRESQEHARFMADVLERSSQPFAVGYPDGRLMTCNPAYCELTGYSEEELCAIRWLEDLTPPEWHEAVTKAAEEIRRTGQPQRFKKEYIRKDGSWVPIEVFAHASFDSKGNLQYYYSFFTDITERKRAEEELRQSYVKLQRTLEGTINTLVSAIEMRDPYTAGHQRRVTQLACAIAKEMGLPEEQIEGIRMAGLIHDIGKINVPAEILSKPGPLTKLEYGLIKMHPQIGHDVLETIEFPWPVAQIVLQHHERIDSSGYPAGLSSEDILLEARILGVADVVEAMASHRPYRSARGIDEALQEISHNRDVLYDPEVVDACLKLFTEKRFTFE